MLIVPDSEVLQSEEFIEEVDVVEQQEEQENEAGILTAPQISLHTMSGAFFPQTLKFTGSIGSMEVSILVDGGSTHNFIQSRIVSSLQLPITDSTKFGVMVGNGETLTCEGMCAVVPIEFKNEFFLLIFISY